MKPKWFILMALGFFLTLCSIPMLIERCMAFSRMNSLENRYQQFASENADSLAVAFDSILINKIAANAVVADRVREIVISDGDFAEADFSQLKHLPNLEEVVIYSGSNCDALVPTVNQLKRLKTITFADCGLSDTGFDQLNHPGITSVKMSDFTRNWSDEAVSRLKGRMPDCSFEIAAQE